MMYYSDMTSHSLGEGDGMWLIVVVTCYVLVLTSCPLPLPGWRLVSECEWCGWRWHTSVCAPSVCPIPLSPFILAALSPAQLQHGKKLIGFLQAGNF